MVGESELVSPTFSLARNGLYWIGGFLFIFLTIAVIGSLMSQASNSSDSRTQGGNASRRTGTSTRSTGDEPSMGLTPETATAGTSQ